MGAPGQEESGPCPSPRTAPHHYHQQQQHPILTMPLFFPRTPALCQGSLRLGSPGASNILVFVEPHPWCRRVLLNICETLRNKSAPVDSQGRDSRQRRGSWKRRREAFAEPQEEALATLPRRSAEDREPLGTLRRLLSARMPPPWAGLALGQWLGCGAGGGVNSSCSRGSGWRGRAEGGGPIRTW